MKKEKLKTNRSTKRCQGDTAVSLHSKHAVSDHLRIEERSIALHRAVVKRILKNPELMDKARENLQKYLEQFARDNRPLPKALSEWQDILKNQSLETVLEFLVSSDESAVRLRQSSPFAGILTPKERWKIYETFRPGAYYPSRRQHRSG